MVYILVYRCFRICSNWTQFHTFVSISAIHVSLFKLVRLFPSKYHYKTLKKKLFISIKHDLMIKREMPETHRQKKFFLTHHHYFFSTYLI